MAAAVITGRVLLVSSDEDRLDDVEAKLVEDGYEVRRCVAAGAPTFPCVGLAGGTCPLDEPGGIDVALAVRQVPWRRPTPSELGVTCAVRAAVPLAVIATSPHPFAPWANVTSTARDRAVEVCEDAIADALEEPRAAVTDAVGAVLATHGVPDTPIAVRLDRRQGRLRVRIVADVPGPVGAMAATRAAVAVRRFDRSATELDIDVVAPTNLRPAECILLRGSRAHGRPSSAGRGTSGGRSR